MANSSRLGYLAQLAPPRAGTFIPKKYVSHSAPSDQNAPRLSHRPKKEKLKPPFRQRETSMINPESNELTVLGETNGATSAAACRVSPFSACLVELGLQVAATVLVLRRTQRSQTSPGHMGRWLWLKKTVPKWNPGKWKVRPKPA